VPKLPRARRPLPVLLAGEVVLLAAGTRLWRCYALGGAHPGRWNQFRFFGPLTSARFDPQPPPASMTTRGVMYLALDIPTVIAEVFQATRTVNRHRRAPWLVGLDPARDVSLLDLGGGWPTRAGASQAINSGRKDHARSYAVAAYEEYDHLDGILYPSSMLGRVTDASGKPTTRGICVALFDRAADAIPDHPAIHHPLAHPGLALPLGRVARDIGYRLLELPGR
jgi:RES domain